MRKVAIVMGSDSDFTALKPAITALSKLGVPTEVHVLSAHRTPAEASAFTRGARAAGFGVIIAAAGKAAHLAGAMAAGTTLPVIGIPIDAGLNGLDALLSTVQMPPGIPVATVAVNGAQNAALLAAEMLAIEDEELRVKLDDMRDEMARKVLGKDAEIQKRVAEMAEE